MGEVKSSTLTLIDTGAEFSPDRTYRYRLWRRWADGPMLMVIGLNPSTADERDNDPTIRRCIGYARAWGLSGITMMNLFPHRATDPKDLRTALMRYPIDDLQQHAVVRNLVGICEAVAQAEHAGDGVLAAWGAWGRMLLMGERIRRKLGRSGENRDIACLGLTKSGEPRHPLYLRADATPLPFLGDGGRLCRPSAEARELGGAVGCGCGADGVA